MLTRFFSKAIIATTFIISAVIPVGGTDRPTMPVTGSFINLAYMDVRNKYTNPAPFDNTDPALWRAKVNELADMGMEYLIFMEIANEGRAYYPSRIMPAAYDTTVESPVDAIMDEAARRGMKVFLSTGWAHDQDDNLRDPAIKARQLEIMDEVAALYGRHDAFYGWYLPVEDCLGPVLSDHAVEAVNALTARARSLTPEAKVLVSPYGLWISEYDNPEFARQIHRLNVDIIAYQDEIGCVREPNPLPRLKENWKRLREIHDNCGIEFWANCETFTWERGTNSRESALVPASYPRLLAQQSAATAGGVERIVSFMFQGIIENPASKYQLGQPVWSGKVYNDYTAWRAGDRYWQLMDNASKGHIDNTAIGNASTNHAALIDGITAEYTPDDTRWTHFKPGLNEIVIEIESPAAINEVFVRMLYSHKDGIDLPDQVYLYTSTDGREYTLQGIQTPDRFPNNLHDAWAEGVLFTAPSHEARYVKIAFNAPTEVLIDEVVIDAK